FENLANKSQVRILSAPPSLSVFCEVWAFLYDVPMTRIPVMDITPVMDTPSIIQDCRQLRTEMDEVAAGTKQLAEKLKGYLRASAADIDPKADYPEMIANAVLSFRHLEYAVWRLGECIQAANAGEAVR